MWEVEAVYSCFIPQDYTSLNTDKDTLYITPLGPPQAREALSNVTMNKFLVSSLFFPRKLFTLAAVANPVGPSLVRTVAHIIIRNMQRRIRERPSNVALRVAVPPPPPPPPRYAPIMFSTQNKNNSINHGHCRVA